MTMTCYVSMPFGAKPDPKTGDLIDFNRLYNELVAPAIISAGISPVRGYDSEWGAVIQKGVLALVLQSDLMIADVTVRDPNVIYELGIRFATHPNRTIILDASIDSAFFHLSLLRRFQYSLRDGQLVGNNVSDLKDTICRVIERNTVTSPIFEFFPHLHVHIPRDPYVFIGHERNSLWIKLKDFLENDVCLKTVSYESESQVGLSIVHVLETMLARASFAILVMTAEDATGDQKLRARQNVIHEAGLFQGSLGFPRAIVLRQDTVEEFSNIAGLQHISFKDEAIDQTFHELQRVLKRENLIRAVGAI